MASQAPAPHPDEEGLPGDREDRQQEVLELQQPQLEQQQQAAAATAPAGARRVCRLLPGQRPRAPARPLLKPPFALAPLPLRRPSGLEGALHVLVVCLRNISDAARLKYAGVLLTVVTCFKYLGINFYSTTCIAGAAAPARTQAVLAALHDCRARCAALGVESAPSQLRLFSALVDSKLSYGAEVWGMQLAAKAAAAGGGGTRCATEKLHLGYLRQLLGVRQSTPNAVVLAETGERPLWTRWLLRATRLWNRALAAPEGSLLRQAVMTSAALATAPGSRTPARQPWAQQLAAALIAAGVEISISITIYSLSGVNH